MGALIGLLVGLCTLGDAEWMSRSRMVYLREHMLGCAAICGVIGVLALIPVALGISPTSVP